MLSLIHISADGTGYVYSGTQSPIASAIVIIAFDISVSAYVAMLYGPIQWLTSLPRVLAQARVSAGKVFEILEEDNDISDTENAVSLDIKGDIEFKNVYFG